MRKLIIDGEEHEFEDGINLIQACELAGVEIPRFCYHERLSIAGNCRMCLIEVKGLPKPIASCAMNIDDLRPGPNGEPPEVFTTSPTVKKAREGVMEFLLINHPLDCPICDQGGECDLQDQAMAYGEEEARFTLNKRAVEDKNIGPLIKTVMTRCIHCTRCVRFMTELAGVEELGLIGRGEDAEIMTYLEKGITSELSGNIIDLCPVGALTSKPYAFAARPWELKKTETIDVMDAVGSNIRVDTRGREVMRILPRVNHEVNEEWISDKTRFVWDGLRTQRLDQPYVREGGKLRPASWEEAFDEIANALDQVEPEACAAIAGDLVCVEEVYAFKDLITQLGWKHFDCRVDGSGIDPAFGRAGYLFNTKIAGIDEADAILLVGANPRLEASVVNARIRRRWRTGACQIGLIGQPVDLTYPYEYLGAGPQTLQNMADGDGAFLNILKHAERPMIILGGGAISRSDAMSVIRLAVNIAQSVGALKGQDGEAEEASGDGNAWIGFNILGGAAGRAGALDIGFVPQKDAKNYRDIVTGAAAGDIKLLYLLGADSLETRALGNAFVIYQGSHGDNGAHGADVILPGAAYTEKAGTYVNLEGRVQQGARAAFPPGESREDWAVLRALSAELGKTLPYDSLSELRAALYRDHPHMAALDEIAPVDMSIFDGLGATKGTLGDAPFGTTIEDYYFTNPIARSSATMAELSALMKVASLGSKVERAGADG